MTASPINMMFAVISATSFIFIYNFLCKSAQKVPGQIIFYFGAHLIVGHFFSSFFTKITVLFVYTDFI